MSKKIPLKTAEAEIKKWLDHKRVKPKKRESLQDNIDSMVDSIVDWTLVLQEDMKLVHTLSFPLENDKGEVTVKELIY